MNEVRARSKAGSSQEVSFPTRADQVEIRSGGSALPESRRHHRGSARGQLHTSQERCGNPVDRWRKQSKAGREKAACPCSRYQRGGSIRLRTHPFHVGKRSFDWPPRHHDIVDQGARERVSIFGQASRSAPTCVHLLPTTSGICIRLRTRTPLRIGAKGAWKRLFCFQNNYLQSEPARSTDTGRGVARQHIQNVWYFLVSY